MEALNFGMRQTNFEVKAVLEAVNILQTKNYFLSLLNSKNFIINLIIKCFLNFLHIVFLTKVLFASYETNSRFTNSFSAASATETM